MQGMVRARCQTRHSSEVTVVRRGVRRCGDGAGAGHSSGARAPLEEMSITLTTTPPLCETPASRIVMCAAETCGRSCPRRGAQA